MEWVNNREGDKIIINVISVIKSNKEYLSRIDGEIGDGDHGVNMNKGFTIAESRINHPVDISECFRIIGEVLMMEIGGSMGPIYGTFFESLYKKSDGVEKITSSLFCEMLKIATESVIEVCEAEPGQKTLIDTLVPACNALEDSIKDGSGYASALADMVGGARKGMESTKEMVAKKGRSARLGERSRGVLDAGAVSCYLILESMAEAMTIKITSD